MAAHDANNLMARIDERLAALGMNAREASLKAGLTADAIRNVSRAAKEKKPYNPRSDTLRSLAGALETTVAWLTQEVSPESARAPPQEGYRPPPQFMNTRDTMPVYASAEGGNGHLIVTTDEIDRVPRPYTLEGIPDAYAILITGESMVPAYEPGDHAWVNPRLPPHRDTDCILYSVNNKTDEAQATIKRLKSWDNAAWHLRQWNPATDFKLERRLWTKHHRVVGNFRRR